VKARGSSDQNKFGVLREENESLK